MKVIKVQQQYTAGLLDLIPKCFRKLCGRKCRPLRLFSVIATLLAHSVSDAFSAFRRQVELLKNCSSLVTAAFLIVAALALTAIPASALSVREYESASKTEQTDRVIAAIDKIIAEVAKVNPGLSNTIHDYFYVTPAGKQQAPGVITFGAELLAVDRMADNGKLDRDKVQIEGILLDIVKTDLLKKQPEKK